MTTEFFTFVPHRAFDLSDVHPEAKVVRSWDNCVVVAAPAEARIDLIEWMAQYGLAPDPKVEPKTMLGAADVPPDRLLSTEDRGRLSSIEPGATRTPLAGGGSVADIDASDKTPGTSEQAARADHKHRVLVGPPAAITVGTAGSAGSSERLARADHVHPLPSAAPGVVDAAPAQKGQSLSVSRADHKHQVSTGKPVALGDAASEGRSKVLSRADHVHPHGELGGGPLHAPASPQRAGFLSAADKAKLDTVETGANRVPLAAGGRPSSIAAVSGDLGREATAARADHVHGVKTAPPVPIGSAGAEGSSSALSRADHVHSHGSLPGGDAHAVATQTEAGFLSAFDKVRIDMIGKRSYFSEQLATAGGAPYFDDDGIPTLQLRDASDRIRLMIRIPTGCQTLALSVFGRAAKEQSAGARAALLLRHRQLCHDADVGRWSSAHELPDAVRIPAATRKLQQGSRSSTLSALQLRSGLFEFEIWRDLDDELDTLDGPYNLVELGLEFH